MQYAHIFVSCAYFLFKGRRLFWNFAFSAGTAFLVGLVLAIVFIFKNPQFCGMAGSLFGYFVIFQPGHDLERKGVSSFIYCALIACFIFTAFGHLFF